MSGIIAFGTFHGSTREVAQKIADKTGFTTVDLGQTQDVDLSEYDTVVICSGIQKFQLHKAVTKFVRKNEATLADKKLYMACTSMSPKLPGKEILAKLSPSLAGSWYATSVGGRIRWNELSFSEKIIIKIVSIATKQDISNIDSINDKKIDSLIKKILG